jgi:hypothetical protein
VVVSCEHSNEPEVSLKGWEFNWLNDRGTETCCLHNSALFGMTASLLSFN